MEDGAPQGRTLSPWQKTRGRARLDQGGGPRSSGPGRQAQVSRPEKSGPLSISLRTKQVV